MLMQHQRRNLYIQYKNYIFSGKMALRFVLGSTPCKLFSYLNRVSVETARFL